MTSRHTWRNVQGDLVTLSNQELARLERTNRQQPKPTNTTMDDHDNQDDLAAAMALMQQQMLQMQRTMQAHEHAAQQAAEHATQQQQQQGVPRNFPATRSAINPLLHVKDMTLRSNPLSSTYCRGRCSMVSRHKYRWITSRTSRKFADLLVQVVCHQTTSSAHCSHSLLMGKPPDG